MLPSMCSRLSEIGVHTIGQLANMPGYSLERLLGRAAGEKLTALAWNRDPREIRTHHRAQSAGAQSARSARSLLKSKFSDPRFGILPTESLAGFGRNPAPVGL